MLVLMNYAPFRARVDTLEQTGDLGTGTYLSMGLAAAPDGNAAALGQSDKQVRVVRLADRQALFAFGPTINRPSGLAYSPDGRLLAVSGPDSSATIHDAANGKPVAVVRLAEQVFETLAFTPDSRQLLLGYAGGLLVVDAASGSTIANIPFGALPPNAVAVARGGGLMAAAAGNTILLIQPGEWKVAQTLSMPESSATALAFSADGSLLAAGSADGKVWLWDAAAGKALGSIVIDESGALAVTRVLFNSPGDRLAAVTEQSVSVWRSP
jgi:WD40 repeat protein